MVSVDILTTLFAECCFGDGSDFSQIKWRQEKRFLSYLNLSGDSKCNGNDRKNNIYNCRFQQLGWQKEVEKTLSIICLCHIKINGSVFFHIVLFNVTVSQH